MFQTYITYISLYVCLLSLGSCLKKNNENISKSFYIAVLFFSFVVGMRWMVGIDYPNYYDIIKGYTTDYQIIRIEPIPRTTASIIRNFNLPFYLWFIVMAIIQYCFLLFSFKEQNKTFIVWGIFFFLSDYLAFSLNVVRQAVAITIILFSYQYVVRKSICKFLFLVFLATLCHYSAIICLPIYIINRFNNILKIKYQLVIFFFLLFYGEQITNHVLSSLGLIGEIIGYAGQLEIIQNKELLIGKKSGLGVIFYVFRFFILIIFSRSLCKRYSNLSFHVYYNIMFIGLCLYLSAMYDMYLSRILLYFKICEIIVFSIFFYDSFKKNMIGTLRFSIALVLMLMHIAIIINSIMLSGKWMFIWDVERFY